LRDEEDRPALILEGHNISPRAAGGLRPE
jgi:hypothetical protein